jgi:rod shape-determining protein MreD
MIRPILSTAIWLIAAAAFQAAWSERIQIGWGKPDFLLVTAVVLSLHRSADAAAVTGFFAGLLQSAIWNRHMAALTISRTITCFFAHKVHNAMLGTNIANIILVMTISTALSSILFFFIGLPRDIGRWATDTIGAIVYNDVLAVPTYWLYRKLTRTAPVT